MKGRFIRPDSQNASPKFRDETPLSFWNLHPKNSLKISISVFIVHFL